MDLLWAHVRERPDPLQDRAPDAGIGADVEAVVMRLLEKEPDARFQTAAEVKVALEATSVAHAWTDADSKAAWGHYELPVEDDLDEALEHGKPASTKEVGTSPAKPVTLDSTGLRQAVSDQEAETGRPSARPSVAASVGGVPWPLLLGVSVGVAVLTAAIVVLLLKG